MIVNVSVTFVAAIPVGHRVTIYALERRKVNMNGPDDWVPAHAAIVCDDTAQIVFATGDVVGNGFSYRSLVLDDDYRKAAKPLQGQVAACTVLTQHVEHETFHHQTIATYFDIETDPQAYR